MSKPIERTPGPPIPPGADQLMDWMTWFVIEVVLACLIVWLILILRDFVSDPTPALTFSPLHQAAVDLTKTRFEVDPELWPWLDEQAELAGLRLTPKRKYEVAA